MTRTVLKIMLFCMALLLQQSSFAQLLSGKEKKFTHADSLRGMLTPFRTCYDVTYYDLNVDIDMENKSISGYNKIYFDAVSDFEVMQVDLSSLWRARSAERVQRDHTEPGNATRHADWSVSQCQQIS